VTIAAVDVIRNTTMMPAITNAAVRTAPVRSPYTSRYDSAPAASTADVIV